MTYSDEVLADTPLGYWRHGEAPGSTSLQDSSGNGRDASGPVELWPEFGIPSLLPTVTGNTAARYAGSDSVGCLVPYGPWMDLASFTFETWIDLSSGSLTGIQAIATRREGVGSENAWTVRIKDGSVNVIVWRNSLDEVVSPAIPGPGVYHLVVVVTPGKTTIYLNGSEFYSKDEDGTSIAQTSSDLHFGLWGSGTEGFDDDVVLDEVALYSGDIGANRVAAHYIAGTGGDMPNPYLVSITPPNEAEGQQQVSLDIPPGVADGDLMYAHLWWEGAASQVTPPLGWKLLEQASNNGGANNSQLWIRVANKEPSSVSWSFGNPVTRHAGAMVAYRGLKISASAEDDEGLSAVAPPDPHGVSPVNLSNDSVLLVQFSSCLSTASAEEDITPWTWTDDVQANLYGDGVALRGSVYSSRIYAAELEADILAGQYAPPAPTHQVSTATSEDHSWITFAILMEEGVPDTPVYDSPSDSDPDAVEYAYINVGIKPTPDPDAVEYSYMDIVDPPPSLWMSDGIDWLKVALESDVTTDMENLEERVQLFIASIVKQQGLPTGGSAGQVLKKLSDDNYDAVWATETGGGPGGLPVGGEPGEVLTKNSNFDGDATWQPTANELPKGGAEGQVLSKSSDITGEYEWKSLSYSGGGATLASNRLSASGLSFPTTEGSLGSPLALPANAGDRIEASILLTIINGGTYGYVWPAIVNPNTDALIRKLGTWLQGTGAPYQSLTGSIFSTLTPEDIYNGAVTVQIVWRHDDSGVKVYDAVHYSIKNWGP